MTEAILVGDTDGRIVLANRAAGVLGGLAPEAMLGLPPEATPWKLLDQDGRELGPDERPALRAVRGEANSGEYRIIRADGGVGWVWWAAAPLRDDDGRIRGVVAVGHDVSEERERRQRALEAEKLRALGQLAGGVAHDLNQYLGLVIGHADLVRRTLDHPNFDQATVGDSLDALSRAAVDGGETVRRLLAFGRPRQERPERRVDLGELVGEVAKLTAPRWRDAAQAEGRPISLFVESEADTVVAGDPAGLREALANLVLNAVDALPNGGTIRLHARGTGDRVLVEVADSGIGMSPEVRAKVFEPFFTTKGAGGTGLGLAIVYGVVQRHGGEVVVDSSPDGGATFRLSLPAAPNAAREVVVNDAASTYGPYRILAVDDEPRMGAMIARMLAHDGHAVVVATSGEEALVRLAAEPFDLVISDLAMGDGMNGWALAERVCNEYPATRFVLATGWGAAIEPEEAATRGVQAVLAKPYRLADLQRIVTAR